jgi:hypothetical protein
VSIHLTIGVHTWTRYALAEQLVGQALRTLASADPTARRSPPMGLDFSEAASLWSDASSSDTCWRTRSNAPTLTRPSDSAGRGSRHHAPPRWVRSGTPGRGSINPDTVINLRRHLAASLITSAGER